MKFEKNLMMGKEAKKICKKFNEIKNCSGNCKKCNATHHPFSMLYKLGFLGQLKNHNWKKELEQDFIDSRDVSYITGENLINLNSDIIYMLHPALTKSIEHMNKKVKHFSGFIIGKGQKVLVDKVLELQKDYSSMVIKDFNQKYFYDKI